MAEHDYDEVQEIELDYTGYTRPFNRSNWTKNEQQKKSITIETTGKPTKRCVYLWIGIFIGSIVSGITVFLVVKYSGILSSSISTCFWTEWTVWTGCNSLLVTGTENRVQIYTGYDHNCQQIEKVETRACNDNVSSCFWTDWTSWTPCKLSPMIEEQPCAQIGKQTRSQVFTGYSKNCVHQDRYETKSCYDRPLDIKFDPNTLYSSCFLSDDHTILSNQNKDRTPNNPNAESRFRNYRGAMVNTCVEKSTSIYYEIYFQYVITSNLPESRLVLEFGIGELKKIDNYYYVGNNNVSGWSFHLANCLAYNKVCLFYEDKLTQNIIKPFSNNTAGTHVNGTFGILIDRVKHKFSLMYSDTVLFTFHDVLSNVLLCPVFGVYNIHWVQVDLQIVSVGNMTYAP